MAWSNLGVAHLKRGDVEEAQAAFEKAVKLNPANVTAINNIAQLLVESGRLRTAARYLVDSLKIRADNEQALLLLSRVYELSDLMPQAERVWVALSKLPRTSLDDRLALVVKALKLECYRTAGVLLDALEKDHPDDDRIALYRARQLAVTGKADKALGMLQALLTKHPDDSVVRTDTVAVLLRLDRAEEALNVAEAGTRYTTGADEIWFAVGACLEKLGRTDNAVNAYVKAIRANEDHAQALNNLGVLEAGADQADQAIGHLRRAVAADPYYWEALFNLGRALVLTKRDHAGGVKLLARVGMRKNDAGKRARAFIKDLEAIAEGRDPGWAGKTDTGRKERGL